MMPPPRIPPVLFRRQWRSSDEVEAMASRWYVEIARVVDEKPVAALVPASPEGIALLIALSALPCPAILLDASRPAQPGQAPLPAGTKVVVPPSAAAVSVGPELGGTPHILPDWPGDGFSHGDGESVPILRSPGFVLYSSGSTGHPRAVYRRTSALLAGAATRVNVLGLVPGDGIVAGGSLARGHGLTRLLSAMTLGGPFAMLESLDHRTALHTLALPTFALWSANAHFAELFTRCTLEKPPKMPRVCIISSPISPHVFDAFRSRFGVPLRQNYSSSETGQVAVNSAPDSQVVHDSVGQPLPGVEVRVCEHPDNPAPAGEVGRIWIRSPWLMEGYGIPPHVERRTDVGGWWATRDRGSLTVRGELRLAGRMDDRIRTREGQTVDLAFVAECLRAAEGVRDAVVVSLDSPSGAVLGAVIECDPGVDVQLVRNQLSAFLPPWGRPRAMKVVHSLPRLPDGKADRPSCLAALHEAL
jgi:acyl-CoA synthetase (AMP-forming)/AMP-acid ligase II